MYEMTNFSDDDSDGFSQLYFLLLTIIAFMIFLYTLARYLEQYNRLEYEDRFTRIFAGFIARIVGVFHSSREFIPLPDGEPNLVVAGPHRTGVSDALALFSNMKGEPPRFFATTGFNGLPGVQSLMRRFKVIPVDFSNKGKSNVLKLAGEVLDQDGRVVLFPQGNIAYEGKKPHIVYNGAAKMAIDKDISIHVVRLDGYTSIKDPLMFFFRDNRYYRAFLSFFCHPNNIKTNLCWEVDVHLRDENVHLPMDEKIKLINAEIYAFYRHTEELEPEQIEMIKDQVRQGEHLAIWENRIEQYIVEKKLKNLEADYEHLDEESALSMVPRA
jgi:1-acyl-sn-glycerol-3-phosphate acyltransferase